MRKKKFHTEIDSANVQKECGTDLHKVLEKKERKNQLLTALERLSPEEKEIIVLTKFERLKYAEVANMMGLSESAIKVKIHRSVKKLRGILVNEMNYEV